MIAKASKRRTSEPTHEKGSESPKLVGLTVRIEWDVEPVNRAQRMFEKVWAWLESEGVNDIWARAHGIARHCHPDYRLEAQTRVLTNGAPGAIVYLCMERGEYRPDLMKLATPTLWRAMPRERSRGKSGVPIMYMWATLHTSALLACNEFDCLARALEQEDRDSLAIARHLYWFERFTALWVRTGTDRPPNLNQYNEAKVKAAAWRKELVSFHCARVAAHRGRRVSMKESAENFVKGRKSPAFDAAYDALRKATSKPA